MCIGADYVMRYGCLNITLYVSWIGSKRVDNDFKEIDQKKMAHTYQELTDANVDNYISESFLKIRNNYTPNMLNLSHSDRNRGEGGSYDRKWEMKTRSLQ